MNDEIKTMNLSVEDSVLEDLKERLDATRWPDSVDGSMWEYGANLDFVKNLCEYWKNDFDWRSQEELLNQWDHYQTEIDGENIHFIRADSKVKDALPLVLTHGWPGSVFEFYKVIEPLRDPVSFGGSEEDAFHVICPSLPGYGFSGPTRSAGWDVERVAKAWITLVDRLGFERYGAQGGDWGALVTTLLGLLDPSRLAGIHVNMVVSRPPKDLANPKVNLSESELADLAAARHFQDAETGYQKIQGTKPQTLAYGLMDSPAGLAAWIGEKFRTWSDCGGDPLKSFSRDELLTNMTIYWVTKTINSSTRLYYESQKSGSWGAPEMRVEVPTGCALFPSELFRPPRSWADRSYNIVQWTEMPSGGHFAALEEPELLVEDIRSLYRKLR